MQSRLYIPVRRGEILFTTRDERILGHPGLVPVGAGIEVSRMGEEEAMKTFCRIVGSEDPAGCPATGQLLRFLDGLPLAIAQAATYIRTTHMPTTRYLAQFQESEDHQKALLSEPLPAALRENKTNNSRAVMTTWALTVQKIEQQSPLSIKLLQVMSFLDPDNLPFSLIEAVAAALSTETGTGFKQLMPLVNFGLLTRQGSSNYRLHRLVSLWTRVKMSLVVRYQCIDQAAVLMNSRFPQGSSHNVTEDVEMLPHAISILDHIGSDGFESGSNSSWDLQQNVIVFLCRIGQLQLAMKHAQLSLEQGKVFEQDESKRYIARARLGGVNSFMAEYATAIKENQPVLGGQECTLGEDHHDTLMAANDIAVVLSRKGEYDKALGWHQRVLDSQEKAFGKDHPDTHTMVNNIAVVFSRKGEYSNALEWYRRTVDGQGQAFGRDYHDALATANNIALGFHRKGEYDKALEWYRSALDGQEKALGKYHPDTLMTFHNMAGSFRHKGEYHKALEWYQRALDGLEKALGKDHPDTLKTVHNIALLFYHKKEYDKALEWYQRALDGQEEALGKDHPDTLTTVHNIALLFDRKKEYHKALEWYQRALDGQERALGKDHPDTLTTVHNIALLFDQKKEYDKALGWYQRALDAQEKALGKDHPDTLKTVNNMAGSFRHKGEYHKALELYQRALDGREKAFGKDHPHTIRTVKKIARLGNLSSRTALPTHGSHRKTNPPR